MKILEVKNAPPKPEVMDSDRQWLQGLSFRELLEHLREGSLRNRFHSGLLGRFFADTLAAKRAALPAEEAAEIEKAVNELTEPVEIKGTVH